ncbi:MAG: GNAT family N-acetyltransferase [Alphaproteobacteria bacterium]
MITIRPENPADIPAIYEVEKAAFGQADEANLVNAIRGSDGITLSLVAEMDDRLVGHILFSPAWIGDHDIVGAGLGPLAVHPDFQKTGVGAALTHAGLAALRQRQVPFSFLLGHPTYYPKFGYKPASPLGLECPFGPARDAWMVIILDDAKMAGVTGMARYHPAFYDL